MGTYQNLAAVTENTSYKAIVQKLSNNEARLRLLHAAVGICTESGEIMEIVKKAAFYDAVPNRLHLIEELGDLMWYVALAANTLGLSFEDIQAANIRKLRARYGEAFSNAAANNRNLAAELEALIGKDHGEKQRR
jgi:NTP pyrophosphatase (non-canonical NTP hydrolase)